MNPHEINQWLVIVVIGLPLAVAFGGPYLWRGVVLLGLLALLASHPVIGFTALGVIALWRPIRWAIEFFIGGFFAAEGVKAAGLFRRSPRRLLRSRRWTRSAPRSRGRRPDQYFPFDDGMDRLGE
jgi:hypothetical protein